MRTSVTHNCPKSCSSLPMWEHLFKTSKNRLSFHSSLYWTGATFPLLLNAPLPLSHLGTAGKLQAHNMGNAMVVLDRFVNIRVLLSVIT